MWVYYAASRQRSEELSYKRVRHFMAAKTEMSDIALQSKSSCSVQLVRVKRNDRHKVRLAIEFSIIAENCMLPVKLKSQTNEKVQLPGDKMKSPMTSLQI